MIDIHSHILPNIDDGARSIEETFNLIKEAENVGFKAIVATSHYSKYYQTETPEREMWVNIVYKKIQEQDIKTELYLGNEIYLSENTMKILEEGKASTINDTSYVLFELPFDKEPLELYNVVSEMLQNKLVPILAHPERYAYVQQDPELVYDLIQKGVLMQANYGSIIGAYGRKAKITVKKLLENNMIHFLGSDCHRQNTIYPKIPKTIIELKKVIGENKLEELSTINPKLVLGNKRIEISEPNKIELTLKEKILMKIIRN